MSVKKIPSKTIVTCDRCGASEAGGFGRRGMEAKVREWSTSFQGDTMGGDRDLDFCCDCANSFVAWRCGDTDNEGRPMTNAARAQDMHPSDVEALLDERDELRAALATLRAKLLAAAEAQEQAAKQCASAIGSSVHGLGLHQGAAMAYRQALAWTLDL